MNRYLVMFDLIQVNTSERFGAIVLGTSIYDVVETLKTYSYQGQPVGAPASFIKLAMDE